MRQKKTKLLVIFAIISLIGIEFLYSNQNSFLPKLGIEPCFSYNITRKIDYDFKGDGVTKRITKTINNTHYITQYEGKAFDRINIGSMFNVEIIKTEHRADNRIELIISDVLMPKLDINLTNGIFTATLNGINHNKKDEQCTLKIYTDNFHALHISGAVKVVSEDKFRLDKLSLESSGASSIKFNRDIDVVGNLKIRCSGASNVKMVGLSVKGDYDIELSGASKAVIESGECISAKNIVKCSGASHYSAPNFVTNSLNIHLSGSSQSKVNVLNNLETSIDGASSLRYKENSGVKISGISIARVSSFQ